MCRAVSLGWESGRLLLVQLGSAKLPTAWAPAPALLPPELPDTVSVFGLQLSCPGKVDSEVMTLNAPQLDSNFKKLHILELKRRKSCHPEIEEGKLQPWTKPLAEEPIYDPVHAAPAGFAVQLYFL